MRTRFRRSDPVQIPAGQQRSKRRWQSDWVYESIPAYSVPNGTNAYIVDEFPHRRSAPFPGMEHFCVSDYRCNRVQTSHYGVCDPDPYMPVNSNDLYWTENDTWPMWPTNLQGLMKYRYDSSAPWHMQYYSSYEPHSWSAALSTRMSKWGLGRSGLAESLGEAPELPKLWHFIQKGRGYYRNVNNAYLAYAFGWRPLLDLIPDVLQEIDDYRRRIAPRATRKGGDRVLCYRLPIRPPWVEQEERVISDPRPRWPQMKAVLHSQFRFTKCEAIGMYRCVVSRKPFTGYEVLDRLADLQGIPTFETVWQLMPMSFVVDYFASISGLINRMQGNLLYDIDVNSSALGVRIEGSGPNHGTIGGTTISQDSGTFRYYHRGPMPIPLVEISLPGQYAIPTGIALALQRLPRLPRRWTAASKRAFYRALRSRMGQYATSLAGWPPSL